MQTEPHSKYVIRKPGVNFSLSTTNVRRFTNIIPISRKSSKKGINFIGIRRRSTTKRIIPKTIFVRKDTNKQINNHHEFNVNEILSKKQLSTNESEKYSRKYISQVESLENYYRNMIFVQLKTLNKYTEQKHQIEHELSSYQKELEMYKNKSLETKDKLKTFRILCESNSSLSLYSKYMLEKEETNKLINSFSNKIIFAERNINYTFASLQRISSDIKSLQIIKTHNVKQLIQYYLLVLNEFNDFRNDGISWILYKLLELGYDINKCIKPTIINTKYWNYLKKIAHDKIYIEELRIIYQAIRVKFIKKKDNGDTMTLSNNGKINEKESRTVSTAVSKDESRCNINGLPLIKENNYNSYYEKFLKKYIEQHLNSSRNSRSFNKKVVHYLRDVENEEINIGKGISNYTERSDKDDKKMKLRDYLPKDIIDEVSDIKKKYEKALDDLNITIKLWQLKYKTENEDLKIFDLEKYKLIFHALFGIFTPL